MPLFSFLWLSIPFSFNSYVFLIYLPKKYVINIKHSEQNKINLNYVISYHEEIIKHYQHFNVSVTNFYFVVSLAIHISYH